MILSKKEIKSLPAILKTKLRQLQSAYTKAGKLEREVGEIIESYGIDAGYFDATKDGSDMKESTEALAYIINAEGDVEDNIKLIEEVFLYHHLNKSNN